jgi:hypothetical protein
LFDSQARWALLLLFGVSGRDRFGAADPLFATSHIFLLPHFPLSESAARLSDVQYL